MILTPRVYGTLPWLDTFWLKAGVKEARDLLNQDQTFLGYNAFVAKYNIKTNYLEYIKVMAALKQFKDVRAQKFTRTDFF